MTETLTVKRSELPATVAEVVMGWPVYARGSSSNYPHVQLAGGRGPDSWPLIVWLRWGVPWNPTTDANHMLAVVERLKELGFRIAIVTDIEEAQVDLVSLKSKVIVTTRDASECVAICLAAIEAVTGKRVALEDNE